MRNDMKTIKQYEILETIGHGGMGVVHRAFDTILQRDVAIKVMHDHLLEEQENADRFMNEARAAARLTHPNIVTIFEIGEAECGQYIVMEYVEGQSLGQSLLRHGAFSVEHAVKFTTQVLNALVLAHKNNIQHRDIKPENILITPENEAKILDFGIAKLNPQNGLTLSGNILGTIDYMAAEQLMGDAVDQRADIYATGVVLYELLTSHLPFTGETPVVILYKQLNEEPLPPSCYNCALPEKLDEVIMRALAINAADRWQSAEAFARALAPFNFSTPSPAATTLAGIDAQLDEMFDDRKNDWFGEETPGVRETFIGRKKELKKLIQSFRHVKNGSGKTVILLGEAGVGKSTIAAQLQDYAGHNQAHCLYGACLYQEGMDAYLPFIDALRKYFSGDLRKLPEEQRMTLKAVIHNKVPLLMEYTERFNTVFSAPPEELNEPGEVKSKDLFEGILVLISLLSTIQPIVFILDDLQWADDASLKLFHYLARQIEKSRILLVGISRTDRYDLLRDGKAAKIVDVLARMSREGVCEEIKISRFNRDHCDQLIDNSLKNTIFSEEFYEKIYSETRGNAFFVIETLKYLQESEKIYFEDDAWYDKRDEIHQINVPNRIEDVFSRRLQALDEEKREILQIAAIVGYKVDVSILAELTEQPKIKLLKMLNLLNRELNLLLSTEDGFQFEHPMLRDMLYEEIPPALRREYHLLIAQILEKMHGPHYGALIGEVAEHFRRGGRCSEAVPLLFRAAKRALKLKAYREASVSLENITTCLEKAEMDFPPEVPEHEFLLNCAISYEEIMRFDESLEKYEALLTYGRKQDDTGVQIDALRRMGRVHEKLANYQQALTCFENCLEILRTHPIPNTLSRLFNSIGIIYMQKGEYEVALKNFQKTTEVVDHVYGEYDRAHALTNIGIIHSIRGDHKVAIECYIDAITIYDSLQEAIGKGRALHNLGMAYSDIEEWEAAIDTFNACYKMADQLNDRQLRGLTLLNTAKAYIRRGEAGNSLEFIEKALKIFRRSGDMLNIAECYYILALISQKMNKWTKAEKYFRDSIKINAQKNNDEALLEICQAFGDYYAEKENFQQADEQYNRALKSARNLNLTEKSQKLQAQIEVVNKELATAVTLVGAGATAHSRSGKDTVATEPQSVDEQDNSLQSSNN